MFEHYYQRFLETQQALGISHDLCTHTDTENPYGKNIRNVCRC
jgi:hypothetical protein